MNRNRVIRKIIFFLLRYSALPFFMREIFQRRSVTIIYYHDIDSKTFKSQLAFLTKNYNIIKLRDLIKAHKKNRMDSLASKSLVITFDDGHKSNYCLKGIFKKYNIKPTIFLCSGLINTKRNFWFRYHFKRRTQQKLDKIPYRKRMRLLEKYGFSRTKEYGIRQALSKSEVFDMLPYTDFQSHTRFHSILPECGDRDLNMEISGSKIELEDKYNLKINSFAYPNGDYGVRELSLVKRAGYECGVTTDFGFNSKKTDIYRLKRISASSTTDINELIVRVSGLWDIVKFSLSKRIRVSKYYVPP